MITSLACSTRLYRVLALIIITQLGLACMQSYQVLVFMLQI